MYYAYILQSISHPVKFYYGSTRDLKKRVEVHNSGGNVSTKPNRPWRLQWYGAFETETGAMDFERYLKTASGKAFARKRLLVVSGESL
jgi:predicted GIY-YIG superfamily endonuclease